MKRITTAMMLLYSAAAVAQGTVTIDQTTQRYLGDVSTLDRDKYVTMHTFYPQGDKYFEKFKSEYNINPDYVGSRRFNNPIVNVKNGVIPETQKVYTGVREITKGYVGSGVPSHYFYDHSVDYSTADLSKYSKDIAKYVAESYKNDAEIVPEWIEPLNEPMVHAGDFVPKSEQENRQDRVNVVTTRICEYHRELARAIHAVPELKNLSVMGYSSAFPEFENGDFTFWKNRYGKFIDIAGEDIDVYSLHLYDGSGINNSGGRRSGSNSEAILDIIDAYSFIKIGKVKPVAITEYGCLMPNQPGWTANGKVSNYNPVTSSQASRSQLHFVMNFMERQDNMAMTIPFNVEGRVPYKTFAKSGLWIDNGKGGYDYTVRVNFYEMLKDLKGERVVVNSDNIDIQTQGFVDGKNLYVMLNNLNDNTQTVDLKMIDSKGLKSVSKKSLKIYVEKEPVLSEEKLINAPTELSLEYGETVVLTYTFSKPIKFNSSVKRVKYYANEYLKPIKANTPNNFTISNIVSNGKGQATLRVGVGRDHGKSLAPSITVNGKKVTYNKDIIRGYDQNTRKQFFGLLEIPVPAEMVKSGKNDVSVTFAEDGGTVSSVIMQVQQ